jgi:hypothetical protein
MKLSKTTFAVAFWLLTLAGNVRAAATTCDQAVAQCQIEGANKEGIIGKCQAAGVSCHKTSRFVGPITGRSWKNIRRE